MVTTPPSVLAPDTTWRRFRRSVAPATRLVPGGHLVTEALTYARLAAPWMDRAHGRFVVFAQGRSGSTLLADLLNSSPDVYCEEEILTFPRLWPALYVHARSAGHNHCVYGFKVKIHHLTDDQGIDDPNGFLRRITDEGWQVIHLTRRNVVRQALSALIAEQRRVYHHPVDGPTHHPEPVEVDPRDLLDGAGQRRRYQQQETWALSRVPHLTLTYEDDLLDGTRHQATATTAFEYLGVASVEVRTRLQKIVERSLSDQIANFAEIAHVLAGTEYAGMLEQD